MVKEKKGAVIAVTAAVLAALCLLVLALVFFAGGEPPVIYGVQENIALYTDDDILAALTDGVYAMDQKENTLPVEIAVYDESGALVAEYDESVGSVTQYQAGTYRVVYSCKSAQEVESVLVLYPADKEPPVITGARDLTVTVGGTISYRDGVTVTDNMDENVRLQVDAGQVNLEQAGTYPLTYSAEDARGNRAEITVMVLVEEEPAQEDPDENPDENPDGDPDEDPDGETAEPGNTAVPPSAPTKDNLDALAANILNQIITPDMTQRQQARAIFDYIIRNMRYVNVSDSSDWVAAAYTGFTRNRGDCFNYFACSKELLTLAGIPNIDLHRVGGNSDHYWQLVNVGDGWYHFDACPHPGGHPLTAFLLTEAEVRQYSAQFTGLWLNYYTYDYDACPVTVVGTPEDEAAQPEPSPSPSDEPSEEQPPEDEQSPEDMPAAEPEQPDDATDQEDGVPAGDDAQ